VAFAFGDHVLDLERRELRRSGDLVDLEPQVFDLLAYLVQQRDRVVSKDDLLQAVWGGRIVSESAMTSRINAVRRAVGDSGAAQQVIRTIARKGLRFVAAVQEQPKEPAERVATALQEMPLALPDRPSIAVLPFVNLSADPQQEYFADGMVEEIITALSRIRWLFVIARNSSFTYKGEPLDLKRVGRELGVRYVLEGSVRKAGQRVRITVQLVEAQTSAHLWAERFDGSLEDVFELQDEVARCVAGVIEPTLQAAEVRRSAHRPTSDLTAYDLYLRALPHAGSPEPDRITLAVELLQQAIDRDPNYAQALVLAAHCYYQMDINGSAEDRETGRREAIVLSRRALRNAPDDPGVLANAAMVLGYYGEDLDVAIALVDRSVALNPSYALGWFWSGVLRNWAGQPERALEHLAMYLRLCPRDRFPGYLIPFGIALFFCRRFEEAVARLLESIEHLPNYVLAYRFLAASYVHMGRLGEARAVVQRVRAITLDVADEGERYRNRDYRELYVSGLRLAIGLPVL
jgi:TolB-like protein